MRYMVRKIRAEGVLKPWYVAQYNTENDTLGMSMVKFCDTQAEAFTVAVAEVRRYERLRFSANYGKS